MRAMTSKNLAEVVIEVSRDDCQVINSLSDAGCDVDRLSVRQDRTLHSIKPKDGCNLAQLFSSKYVKLRTTSKGEIWAESCSCKACAFFSKLPFVEIIGSATIGKKIIQVRAVVPSKSDLRMLRSSLRNSGLEYRFLNEKPFVHREMTPKERNLIEMALKKNFFDCENRTSLTELANLVGVSPSSLSESIRRGTKKAVVFYLERTGGRE